MQLHDKIAIQAESEKVWRALNNATLLRCAIPGCERLDGNFEDGFSATVAQKIGPVSAKFEGQVTLSDIVEGKAYRINGVAKAGLAGNASGSANISLEDNGGETFLHYDVEAHLSGKIAQLGNRLVGAVAKKCADKFFQKFKQQLETKQSAMADC